MNKIQEKQNAVNQLFQSSDFSMKEFVRYAEEGHGFCGNDGYYALTYPSDRDEYEIIHEGAAKIPDGRVEISYWTGENSDIIVDLNWYLEQLKEYLYSKGEKELSERVEKVLLNLVQNP